MRGQQMEEPVMVTCQYEICNEQEKWVECGRPAVEVTVKGPGGSWEYELCPEHLHDVVSERGWASDAESLLGIA